MCSEEFALLEAEYVVVRILQKFRRFELDPRDKDAAVGAENQAWWLTAQMVVGSRRLNEW